MDVSELNVSMWAAWWCVEAVWVSFERGVAT